jgi:hypothetical protein
MKADYQTLQPTEVEMHSSLLSPTGDREGTAQGTHLTPYSISSYECLFYYVPLSPQYIYLFGKIYFFHFALSLC